MNTQVNNTEVEEEIEEAGSDTRDTTSSAPTPAPTTEELAGICADIKTNFNFSVDVKPVIYRFKTSVEKDDEGNVISEVKREALELPIPCPSVAGIVEILEGGGKGLELLMDAVEGIVISTARAMISEDTSINATNLDVDKLSWEFIANMPKAERSGGGIAKEVWDDFGVDYVKTMPEPTGKTVDQVTKASKLLVGKLSAVKTNIPVLELLVEQLTIYLTNSKRADEFAPCVEFLVDKANKLVNTTPEELLANL